MNARDAIFIGVLIFFFGIGFFVLYNGTAIVVDKIVEVPAVQESAASVEAFEGINNSINRLDYLIFGMFIALVLALIITSWFIVGHPILIFIYIIVIIMGVVFGAVLSNVWETTAQASVFGNTIEAFPITNNILSYLPIYNAVIGALGLMVMFAKTRTIQDY